MSGTAGPQRADASVPAGGSPEITVIIHCNRDPAATMRCLRSIQAHPPKVPFEVILAGEAGDGSHLDGFAHIPELRHIRVGPDAGVLRACNAAAAMAHGRYLHFLSSEIEVTAGWLDALMSVMRRFPDCGAVGSKLVFPDGRVRQAGGVVWNDGSRTSHGKGEQDGPAFGYVREVDYCSGASLLVRNPDESQAGIFDEAYSPADYADLDLAFRLRRQGLKVYYCPLSVVVLHGVSAGEDLSGARDGARVRCERMFLERWRHALHHRHFAPGHCLFRAREHGRHKRFVLVVDHYVPQPDRDAGSRAIVQTMRQLIAMGFVVKFWTANQHYDPAYRHVLEDAGIEIVAGPRWDNRFSRYIRYAGKEFEHVFLSRPSVATDYIDELRAHSRARLVLYGHDLHFLRMQAQAGVLDDEDERLAADDMRRLELALWQALDGAIYPSGEETNIVADHVPLHKAHEVPLYHFEDDEFIAPREQVVRATGDALRLLFVAGFGHSPNVDAAEWLVREILPRVRRRLPNATLDLVGSNPTQRVLDLAQDAVVRVVPNVSSQALQDCYRNADIAVVPLRFGAGVKLKVLEAMVNGVPVVTTSVGAQGLPGIESCVRVEDDADALAAAIVSIATEAPAACDRRFAAQAYVRRHYSSAAMRAALWRVLADAPPDAEPAGGGMPVERAASSPSPV